MYLLYPSSEHKDEIVLEMPISKSIYNRALIIYALSQRNDITNIDCKCDDILALENLISISETGYDKFQTKTIDIGSSGTAMRFGTAYLALAGKHDFILTGTERMKQRPIAPLISALVEVGAKIEYLEKEGYPPILIRKSDLKGREIAIDSSISSQFISALMMIGPCIKNGINIKLTGKNVSSSYIMMTKNMMESFGIMINMQKDSIYIPNQRYIIPPDYHIEADWSAASYWYSLLAIKGNGSMTLKGLSTQSYQPDSKVISMYESMGVSTKVINGGIVISADKTKRKKNLTFNCIDTPDISMTISVTCCACGIPFKLTGLDTLEHKECRRISVLSQELNKVGYKTVANTTTGEIYWDGTYSNTNDDAIVINTNGDHRIAMSFAPLALNREIIIDDPRVTDKSYPKYWEHISEFVNIRNFMKI